MFWALTLAGTLGFAGEVEERPGLSWDWNEGEKHRWFLQTEVQLPSAMWFVSDYNRQARVAAFQVDVVMECGLESEPSKRSIPLLCAIQDIAIRAAALPGDEGVLPEILAEMDEKLSAGKLQVVLRRDGHLIQVDLEDVNKRNRRISQMHENMRLVLARALSGFDLHLPKAIDRKAGVWAQYESDLMRLPSSIGTLGAAELVHSESGSGNLISIETSGRGSSSPSGSGAVTPDIYAIELEARAVFDEDLSLLRERRWTVLGVPTASSAMAEGGQGIPYGQRGLISYISADEQAPKVGETMEVSPPGITQTAIHPWVPLGRPAGVSRP